MDLNPHDIEPMMIFAEEVADLFSDLTDADAKERQQNFCVAVVVATNLSEAGVTGRWDLIDIPRVVEDLERSDPKRAADNCFKLMWMLRALADFGPLSELRFRAYLDAFGRCFRSRRLLNALEDMRQSLPAIN